MIERDAGRTMLMAPVLAAGLLAGSGQAGEGPARSPAGEAFARFVALAGTWSGTNGHGDPVAVEYTVTSGGSAVVERYHVEGEPSSRDMVTVYHLDGDRLLLDHYCIAGNQPRMGARRIGPGAKEIDFELDSITNLASPGAGRMREAVFRFDGDDRLDTRWTYFENGKEAFVARVSLSRTTKSTAGAAGETR
jgi:hypothetical protein